MPVINFFIIKLSGSLRDRLSAKLHQLIDWLLWTLRDHILYINILHDVAPNELPLFIKTMPGGQALTWQCTLCQGDTAVHLDKGHWWHDYWWQSAFCQFWDLLQRDQLLEVLLSPFQQLYFTVRNRKAVLYHKVVPRGCFTWHTVEVKLVQPHYSVLADEYMN